MPDQNLTLAFDGAVATLTLARPEKLNPIDWSTVKELRAAVARIGAHKGQTKHLHSRKHSGY